MSENTTTREKMIFEATKLFLSRGYGATSITDVVQECGVSKGAFYHHFKSKDDLFLQIIGTMFEELESWMNKELMSKENFKDFLFSYFDYISFFKNMSLEMGITMNMYDLIFDAVKRFPDLKKQISESYKGFFSVITEKMKDAQLKGEVDETIDAENFAVAITVLVEGFILFEVLLEDENIISEKSRRIAAGIWNKIKK